MKQELNIRSIYSFVLGLILTIFIGIFVNTFIPFDHYGSSSTAISLVLMLAAVLTVSIGLFLGKAMEVIANGLLLSSLFTLVYSVGVGFFTENKIIRLLVSTVAVVIILSMGYVKFIRSKTDQESPSQELPHQELPPQE